jgi:septum formation protein
MLILASRSPRRQALLSQFAIPFTVQEADLDETPLPDESPAAMTERLALSKADHVFQSSDGQTWVLGGDTTVAVDALALGKPVDRDDAIAMLNRLSARSHQVISAVALVGPGFSEVKVSITEVVFDTLSPAQIATYCDSGEPFDKAGAYGIQGYAGAFVTKLSGSYSGVVGLPLFETRSLLEKAGLLKLGVVNQSDSA